MVRAHEHPAARPLSEWLPSRHGTDDGAEGIGAAGPAGGGRGRGAAAGGADGAVGAGRGRGAGGPGGAATRGRGGRGGRAGAVGGGRGGRAGAAVGGRPRHPGLYDPAAEREAFAATGEDASVCDSGSESDALDGDGECYPGGGDGGVSDDDEADLVSDARDAAKQFGREQYTGTRVPSGETRLGDGEEVDPATLPLHVKLTADSPLADRAVLLRLARAATPVWRDAYLESLRWADPAMFQRLIDAPEHVRFDGTETSTLPMEDIYKLRDARVIRRATADGREIHWLVLMMRHAVAAGTWMAPTARDAESERELVATRNDHRFLFLILYLHARCGIAGNGDRLRAAQEQHALFSHWRKDVEEAGTFTGGAQTLTIAFLVKYRSALYNEAREASRKGPLGVKAGGEDRQPPPPPAAPGASGTVACSGPDAGTDALAAVDEADALLGALVTVEARREASDGDGGQNLPAAAANGHLVAPRTLPGAAKIVYGTYVGAGTSACFVSVRRGDLRRERADAVVGVFSEGVTRLAVAECLQHLCDTGGCILQPARALGGPLRDPLSVRSSLLLICVSVSSQCRDCSEKEWFFRWRTSYGVCRPAPARSTCELLRSLISFYSATRSRRSPRNR